MKDLYTENYKMLLKEKENLNKWKDSLGSRLQRFNIVKMAILGTPVWLKDLALSLQWLSSLLQHAFNTWPGYFHMA